MVPSLIVVGASLGGLTALAELLSSLPRDFAAAMAVVQHRGIESDNSPHLLQARCALPVVEVTDKDVISAGRVYLAPPDYHLLVEDNHFALSVDARVSMARPSIDVLFESAAETYRERVAGVILTGASSDGSSGAACIKAHQGQVIVEDPDTAECPVMPAAAIAATTVDYILPLVRIGPMLVRICRPNSWASDQ